MSVERSGTLIDSPGLLALRVLLCRVHCTTYIFGKLALSLESGFTLCPVLIQIFIRKRSHFA